MISKTHISAQQPRGRKLNAKVCGCKSAIFRRSLIYGTDRNGTEQFRHIILRNGTGSNAHTTAKNVARALKCAGYRPDAV